MTHRPHGGASFVSVPLAVSQASSLDSGPRANARGPDNSDQALPAHFFIIASHCCVAHLTDSSALN